MITRQRKLEYLLKKGLREPQGGNSSFIVFQKPVNADPWGRVLNRIFAAVGELAVAIPRRTSPKR